MPKNSSYCQKWLSDHNIRYMILMVHPTRHLLLPCLYTPQETLPPYRKEGLLPDSYYIPQGVFTITPRLSPTHLPVLSLFLSPLSACVTFQVHGTLGESLLCGRKVLRRHQERSWDPTSSKSLLSAAWGCAATNGGCYTCKLCCGSGGEMMGFAGMNTLLILHLTVMCFA